MKLWQRLGLSGILVLLTVLAGAEVMAANFYGTAADEFITPTYVSPTVTPPGVWPSGAVDYLYGYGGNDTLEGGGGNDSLYGYDGHDSLNGGPGDDFMAGGPGDDTYYVNSPSDVVYEAASDGIDTVYAFFSYTLGTNVEILYLRGTATNGTGNDLGNSIYGNKYANTLEGLGGNDHLDGRGGKDALYGGDGHDSLIGGPGADYMAGGPGDDTYWVEQALDVVYEAADGGTDKVYATVSYTLGKNVEELELFGTAANGKGNALDNFIYGNDSANTLEGLGGIDYLDGRGGNDSLYGGNGTDFLYGDFGEDKLYGQADNDVLHGGYDNDSLYGGNGSDMLFGDEGNDFLNGGRGKDTFFFAETGWSNMDTIVGFSHASDTIGLQYTLDGVSDASIKGLSFSGGVLDATYYFEGPGVTGNGSESSGIFNDTTTGNIWYNPTSGISGDSVVICTVGTAKAKSLDHTDFVYY